MKGLGTSAVEMIKCLGKKVQALHIHDNGRWHDSHQLPFSMSIAFEPIVKQLKEIGYPGSFRLEADAYLKSNGYTADHVLDGIKEMALVVKKMSKCFDSL